MSRPLVSIIVPLYDCSSVIEKTVRTVAAQTLKAIELVFVDDCSRDGSAAAAEAAMKSLCPDIPFRILSTPENSGPGVARNLGVRVASGEYLAFLDAGDGLDASFCRKMYDAASGRDMAHCDICIVSPDGSSRRRCNPRTSDKKKYLRSFVSYFTTYLYRRDMIVSQGIEFPPYRSAEDSCFLLCALVQAKEYGCVEDALYFYYRDGGSLSGRRDRRRSLWRLKSFAAALSYVKRHGLWREYGCISLRLFFRKGLALSLRDLISG